VNFFEQLFEFLLIGPGFLLWWIGLICLLIWLWLKREAMLTSPVLWKPMAFISLGFGFAFTLLFALAVAVILLPGSEMIDAFRFFALNDVLLPPIFIVSTGIGLACSVIHLRARLDTLYRSMALLLSGLIIVSGTALILAAWTVLKGTWGLGFFRLIGLALQNWPLWVVSGPFLQY
jgi:hypothetical protein